MHGRKNIKLNFDIFEKYSQITNFMKTHPAGAELFRADGRTGRHDVANSGCSQLCEGVKNRSVNVTKGNHRYMF